MLIRFLSIQSCSAAPLIALLLCAGSPACSSERPPDAERERVPRVGEAPCRFDLSAYQSAGLSVSCSDLVVWQDRSTRDREIVLHLARFSSAVESDRPGVVILNGGPGESAQTQLGRLSPAAVAAVTASADLVVYDQRGVGQSTPRLSCPLPFDRALPAEALGAEKRAALRSCLADYTQAGIDLAAYDSRSSADDVDELRAALGYAQLDLIGLSYGSRLALEVVRRHPDAVRAMVLDGVAPPHVPYFLRYGSYLVESLRKLADACAQDAGCAAAYPDLDARFFAAVADLDASPLPLPSFGTSLRGSWLVDDLYASLRLANRHRDLPLLIDGAARRDVARVEAFYAKYPSLLQVDPDQVGADANGMNRSVTCSDRWQYVTPRDVDAALSPLPPAIASRIRGFDIEYNLASCAEWPAAAPDAALQEPVRSPVPTLLLAGDLDPRSPPALADLTAAHLPAAFVRTVAWGGHGVSIDPCVLRWILGFLGNPTVPPQGACGSPIRFTLP